MIDCESRTHLLEVLSNPHNLSLIARDAFKVADKNNKGYIDMKEFGSCLKNVSDFFGPLISNKNLEKEFERLDVNKNGEINFNEFKKYVKEIIEQMLFL